MEDLATALNYDIYDTGFDSLLSRSASALVSTEELETPSILKSNQTGTNPANVLSGILTGNLIMASGYLQSSNFSSGSVGWRITYDGVVEFNIGIFRGSLIAGSIHIPNENTTANSFHVDADGNVWWGCTHTLFDADNNNAAAYILKTGVARFTSLTLSGATISYGKTSWTDDTHAGYYIGTEGIYFGKAADATILKFAIGDGSLQVSGAIVTGAGSDIKGDYIDALSVSKLTTGSILSKVITLSFTEGAGDCAIRCGKTDFTNDETGFILGIDDSDENKVKMLFGSTTEYFNIIGNTFVNTLRVGGYTASVGGTTLLSSTTTRNTTNTTYTKVKEIVVGRRGDYKITVDYKTYMSAPQHGYFSLRKVIGGSETEIRQVTSLGGFDVAYTDTVTGMNAGDGFRLYAKVEAGSDGPCGGYTFNLKVDVNDEIYAPYYTSGYS